MKTSVTDPPRIVTSAERLLSAAELQAHQRRNVRRTALLVAAVAIAIYAAFILSGVLGR